MPVHSEAMVSISEASPGMHPFAAVEDVGRLDEGVADEAPQQHQSARAAAAAWRSHTAAWAPLQQLMRFCGARLRTPQRLTCLTLNEERARWRTTMIYADQVPVWLRIGSQRQLYGNLEVKRQKKRHEPSEPHLSEPGAQVVEVRDEDGMAQMRQAARGEGDRYRATLELAQVVRNVFKPGEKPEVRHARPVLVVNGAHARLSNIDENGRFVEDEVFLVKNKQKVRKAKMSAGNLMLSWSPATRLS